MPRPKKSSKSIDLAERRLSVFDSIDQSMDLGHGLTVKAYAQKIEHTRTTLANYNASLTTVDQNAAACQAAEKELNKMTSDTALFRFVRYSGRGFAPPAVPHKPYFT